MTTSKKYLFVFAVAALSALFGWSCGGGGVTNNNNGDEEKIDAMEFGEETEKDVSERDEDVKDVPDDDQLEVDENISGPAIICPSELSFGYTILGRNYTKVLTCQNIGTETLQIFKVKLEPANSEFELINAPSSAVSVAPGANFNQNVYYEPKDAGIDTAKVTISSNDPLNPAAEVSVYSQYKGTPKLESSVTNIEFGEVLPNSPPVTRSVDISNPQDEGANAILTIDQVKTKSGKTADFDIDLSSITLPLNIKPNERQTFTVSFHPSQITPNLLTDEIQFFSNDPNYAQNPFAIPVSGKAAVPQITCSPTSQNTIDFGNVKMGTSPEIHLKCENSGGATLNIRAVSLTQTTVTQFAISSNIGPAGAFLAHGDFVDVKITYSPDNVGLHQNQLLVESNDQMNPELRVSLIGIGVDSKLTADYPSLDFGTVVIHASKPKTVTVTNLGYAPVKILDIQFETGEQEFSVSAATRQAVTNLTLNRNESAPIEVLYSPRESGMKTKKMTIVSDDSHTPYLDITLNGMCLAPRIQLSCPEHPNFETDGIKFGEVPIDGGKKQTDCYITNVGTAVMTVTAEISINTPQSEFMVVQEAFLPFETGGSKPITIRYTPLIVAGEDNATLTIYSDDPNRAQWDVVLNGKGVNPRISISPKTTESNPYKFGEKFIGSRNVVSFYVSNAGTLGTLTVNDLRFTEDSSNFFRIETDTGLPFLVTAGDETEMRVVFRPMEVGSFQAHILIESNSLTSTVADIYVSGVGKQCDEGYWDVDGKPETGCEYGPCYPTTPSIEVCDNLDNDCDGKNDPLDAIANCEIKSHSSVTCVDHACKYACDEDFHDCGGKCLYNGGIDHCGSRCAPCDAPANSIPLCQIGSGGAYECSFTCVAGYLPSNGQCKRANSPECCGPSCEACPAPPKDGFMECVNGECAPQCSGRYHICGGKCVDDYSVETCGNSCDPCPQPEHSKAMCNGFECGLQCDAFFHQEGNACVLNDTPTCCGPDCVVCPPNTLTKISVCKNYACDFTCVNGAHRCGDECMWNNSPNSCGLRCWPCEQPPNSVAQCVQSGSSYVCDFTCNVGFHEVEQWCEQNNSDPTHCGLQNKDCATCCTPTNAKPLCVDGACTFVCDTGYHACGNSCYEDNNPDYCMVGGSCQRCNRYPYSQPICNPSNWQNPCGFVCNSGNLDLNGKPEDGCEYVCVPESTTDAPDDNFKDANCDGVDGEINKAVFVSVDGNNNNSGSMSMPKSGIQAAIDVAAASGKSYVIVSEGTYNETVILRNGVSVYGGYSSRRGWARSSDYKTVIQGIDSVAVKATAITKATEFAWLTVKGKDYFSGGTSSYAMEIKDSGSNLVIKHCEIRAGKGGPGADGVAGALVGGNGSNGVPGERGAENGQDGGDGGDGGYSPCGSGLSGGSGGRGENDGKQGDSNAYCVGGVGGIGHGACWTHGGIGGQGGDGKVIGEGKEGASGSKIGSINSLGYWVGETGGAGANGEKGTPGCGGGGGGGANGWGGFPCFNQPDIGGGGGGGGGAGCGGEGGKGGSPGGASIALFLNKSSVTISYCIIATAGGGDGGDGGLGASGGTGGKGGSAGSGVGYSGAGGAGGAGANGGKGGRGGGGSGGISVGIYKYNGSSPSIDGATVQYQVGEAGKIGNGGESALKEDVY